MQENPSYIDTDFNFQQSFEDAELKKSDVVEEEGKPDPLTQLVTTFCRGAMTERSGALQVLVTALIDIGLPAIF